ncbi:hypothetical protein KUTeg_024068 [Tegillarca granosa]|uniref:Uncharacterized protein n=1 Tax=Tegillarca granosa TaxID=220873 RepID=A0ABQ9E1V4_TEGGR|nr:hypothetical protein KUTeg_024068 [Tegillarca granosa]
MYEKKVEKSFEEAVQNSRYGQSIKLMRDKLKAGLAVIKGAIQFGHNPAVVSSRVLSYTYGTNISVDFKEGIYQELMKFFDDEGTCRCKNVFSVFKRKGDSITLGEKVSNTCVSIRKSQSSIGVPVYSSSDQDPRFVNDCTKLGNISFELPPYTGKERIVAVEFVFGLTELMVQITSETTGEKIRKYFN